MTERTEATDFSSDDKTALEKLVGLAMWGPGVAWLTGMLTTMMVVQRFVPSHRVDWLTRIYTHGQVFASGTRVRYDVHPEVDPNVVYMFAQNHVNLLDHCTMYGATPHFKQGIELAKHFEIPFYGWFMKQRGTIPVIKEGVSAKEAYRDLTEHMRHEVALGHSLLVFPEGTRTNDGRVGPFKGGTFRIAHALGLPIVPVTVTGMFEVLRKGQPYINPGHLVTVHMDAPIPTKGVPKSKLPELTDRVQKIIANRVDAYYAARAAKKYGHSIPAAKQEYAAEVFERTET
jgi:1-acyl-sn-glycerol-3-phosphate acyltransferase